MSITFHHNSLIDFEATYWHIWRMSCSVIYISFFLILNFLPTHCSCRGLLLHLITLIHTTLGRTPLDEGWARRRDLYLTTHNVPASGGIRTRNPSKRGAADPRLRPRGHRNRHYLYRLFLTVTRVSALWMCVRRISTNFYCQYWNEYQRRIRLEERIKQRLNSGTLEGVSAHRHVCLNKKFSAACGTIYGCLPLVLVAEMTLLSGFNPTRITTGWGAWVWRQESESTCARNMMPSVLVSQHAFTRFGHSTKQMKNLKRDETIFLKKVAILTFVDKVAVLVETVFGEEEASKGKT